jgi:hypothetical protein
MPDTCGISQHPSPPTPLPRKWGEGNKDVYSGRIDMRSDCLEGKQTVIELPMAIWT